MYGVSTANPATLAFDPDLLACTTNWEPVSGSHNDLYNYAIAWIALADPGVPSGNDRATARSHYADVQCAIEHVYPDFGTEARLGLTGVYNTIRTVNTDALELAPVTRNLAGLSTLNVQYHDRRRHAPRHGGSFPPGAEASGRRRHRKRRTKAAISRASSGTA